MNNTKRIKFLIALAIFIIVTLFTTAIVQIVFINKTKNELNHQRQEIERLEKELDYYNHKIPQAPEDELAPIE